MLSDVDVEVVHAVHRRDHQHPVLGNDAVQVFTKVRRGYLWVEEHGGHAVSVLLATSLDGEVDARGDPRHVVRGWQEVVAHLIIKLV